MTMPTSFQEWQKENQVRWFHLYSREKEMCAEIWKDACISERNRIADMVEKNYYSMEKNSLIHEIRRGL